MALTPMQTRTSYAQMKALNVDIARTQTQIATGKKMLTAADNPVAHSQVATLRRAEKSDVTWSANLNVAKQINGLAQSHVNSASNYMARVTELVIAGSSGTISAEDRVTIANELDSIGLGMQELAAKKGPQGTPVFAASRPLNIPIAEDETVVPAPSAQQAFEMDGVAAWDHIQGFANALRAGDSAAITASIDDAANLVAHFGDVRAGLGFVESKIDFNVDALAERSIAIKEDRSALEDTDLTEAIMLLNTQTLTLQAAQAAFGRINQRTLFDFLS